MKAKLVILQATNFCNLNCKYCYLPDRKTKRLMPFETLETIFEKTLKSNLVTEDVTYCWHAGEPLSAGIDFYKKIPALVKKYNVNNLSPYQNIQTNAVLLNEEWCAFFKENDFKIGVSLDGPEFVHDKSRVTWKGRGTHKSVMKGVRLLQKNDIPFSTISVIPPHALEYPDEIFNFFMENNIRRVALNFEEAESFNAISSYQKEPTHIGSPLYNRFYNFMERFYDLWVENESPFEIREFHSTRQIIQGLAKDPEKAIKSDENVPFRIITIDLKGDIYTFSPELAGGDLSDPAKFSIGNIHELESLDEIKNSKVLLSMKASIDSGVNKCKESCSYINFCGGGAPSNKYFENGTFDSSETMYCRFHKKCFVDLLLHKMSPKRQMIKGIGLYGLKDFLFDRPESVTINSGTMEWAGAKSDYTFEPGSIVPKNDWRALDENEIEVISSNTKNSTKDKCISLIKIPDDVLFPLLQSDFTLCKQKSDYLSLLKTTDISLIERRLKDYLGSILISGEKFHANGISVMEPNLFPTTAFNYVTNEWVGLHVDNWDRATTIEARKASRNRICVNISAQNRYLLFINLTYGQLYNVTNISYEILEAFRSSPTDLAREFMRQNPDYPVIKVEVRPGEAYIAPTENIIHDGYNPCADNLDLALTYMGYFLSPAIPKRDVVFS